MTDVEYPVSDDTIWAGPARAIIGLAQGVALYLLFDAYQNKAWPATDGTTFAALCTVAIFVPLIVVSALTHLRLGLSIGWALAVTLICAGLAWYDLYRDPIWSPDLPRNLPSAQLWFALLLGLFIGHGLLIAGAGDRRFIARYPTYFGVSWKHGLQAVMAALFTGIFWLVLWLGADLFKLIKIDFLYDLIRKNWFWIPATTVALNYAIHITDVRVGIVRGMRTLSCNLLSWLLPLLTLIAISFVAALAFTGMEPLWNTRRASSILLTAAASLIFLINSAYQDGARIDGGGEAAPLPRLLRIAVKAASLILIPLVLLAAYGIWLRVVQYGWTPQRLIATACAMVAACYALGYAIAAIIPSASAFRLETTNVVTAFVVLAVLLVLYTPVADPARISVADQMRRFDAGTISPDKLDYVFLRFGAGRYGRDALAKLASQPASQPAAEKAAEVLQKKNRFEAARPLPRIGVEDRRSNITVARPQGQPLPPGFVETDWHSFQRSYQLPRCLTTIAKCDAVLLDLDGDGAAEIILMPAPAGQGFVFRMNNDRSWAYLGNLSGSNCTGMRDALLAGTFATAQPRFKELDVAGRRLRLVLQDDCTYQLAPAVK